jgi:hypothetical protein
MFLGDHDHITGNMNIDMIFMSNTDNSSVRIVFASFLGAGAGEDIRKEVRFEAKGHFVRGMGDGPPIIQMVLQRIVQCFHSVHNFYSAAGRLH